MIQASEQQRLKEAAAQKSNEETQRPGHVRVRRMRNTEARSTTGGPPTLPESPKRARRTSHARATQPTTPIPRPVRNYRASTKYTLRSSDKKSNGAEPNKKLTQRHIRKLHGDMNGQPAHLLLMTPKRNSMFPLHGIRL